MKGSLVLALLFSSTVMAEVTKEVWTCKGSKDGIISTLKVSVDNETQKASGSLSDATMSSEPIALKAQADTYHLGGYVAPGHDEREYAVQLVPANNDDFDYGDSVVYGQAVVVYNGFIDCVGNVGGAEVLSCEVEVTRK